jgi:hypothetical protein
MSTSDIVLKLLKKFVQKLWKVRKWEVDMMIVMARFGWMEN